MDVNTRKLQHFLSSTLTDSRMEHIPGRCKVFKALLFPRLMLARFHVVGQVHRDRYTYTQFSSTSQSTIPGVLNQSEPGNLRRGTG